MRIGTAEVYAVLASIDEIDDALIVNLDLPGGRFFMPLFVRLVDGLRLDDRIEEKIRDRLRLEYTPRHVPDRIVQVSEIPVTLTGKQMEVPVRKILRGVPADEAANRNAMANPGSLDFFAEYASEAARLPDRLKEDPVTATDGAVPGEQAPDTPRSPGSFPLPSQIADVPAPRTGGRCTPTSRGSSPRTTTGSGSTTRCTSPSRCRPST